MITHSRGGNNLKKAIAILLVLFVAFGVSACNDTTIQEEIDSTVSDDKISLNLDIEEIIDIEEIADNIKYDKISAYMEEESRKAFSPYYELLDFQISDYQQEVINGNVEAIFSYKIIHKNYDKDPDTVGYIKEAKKNESKYYQLMYDEYLQPKEMNFHLKVIIDENDSMTLYSNISPKGIEWEETKMTDFILK